MPLLDPARPPSDGIVQLNGNVCDAIKGHLTCEWCGSDQFDLEKTACVADDGLMR
jgi:hypothetical protein